MTVYAETSALLRWLLGAQDGSAIAARLGEAEEVFTSRLTLIEVERVLVRHLDQGLLKEAHAIEARRLLGTAVTHWRVVEITATIGERAAARFPVEPVRALDALHLATALFAARLVENVIILSTDARILENATRLGLGI